MLILISIFYTTILWRHFLLIFRKPNVLNVPCGSVRRIPTSPHEKPEKSIMFHTLLLLNGLMILLSLERLLLRVNNPWHLQEIVKSGAGIICISHFVSGHRNQLSSLYLRTIDHKRNIADNPVHFEHNFKVVIYLNIFRGLCGGFGAKFSFLRQLHEMTEKCNILPCNTYNFDKKRFLIGISKCTKRIVCAEVSDKWLK